MVDKRRGLKIDSYKKASGAVLITVLVFCMLVGLLSKTAIEASILQLKMVQNFRSYQQTKNLAEFELVKMEQELSITGEPMSDKATFIQFVPDTLAYAESEGSHFFQLQIARTQDDGGAINLRSTFSVRKITRVTEKATYIASLLQIKDKLKAQNIIDAQFINLTTGEKVLLIAYLHEDQHYYTALLSIFDNTILSRIPINGKLTTKLLAVDSIGQGSVDVVYLGNDRGELLRLDLSSKLSQLWDLTVYDNLIEGKIVGKPIAGRHPQGKGILLYVLVENHANYSLHSLEHSHKKMKIFFSIDKFPHIAQPLLWQGYLLAAVNSNQLAIIDAFTGKLAQLIDLHLVEEFTVPQEEFIPPKVIIKQPLDKNPKVIISSLYQIKQAEVPILSSRLGRRTWQLPK